jgi:hypothetical protein
MPHPKVKISDNSGNEVSVTNNKLDVNATVQAGDLNVGNVDIQLAGTAVSGNAGVRDNGTLRVTLANNDALIGALYTEEDGPHSSGDAGIMALAVRNDHLASIFAGDDGDYSPLAVNSSGALHVTDFYTTLTPKVAGSVASTATHYGVGALAVRNDVLDEFVNVGDGDYTFLQSNSIGALYVTGGEVENAAVQSEPLLIGGRYDSSARTLGNGDAGAVALNASGHMLMDVVDGGQLDTIIDTLETTLTAIETDQAAIEALLTTIDVDTGSCAGHLLNIKNATYSDDDDWSNDSSRHMLVGGLYQSSMQSVTDGDVAPFQVDANGVLRTSHSITGGADGVTTVSTAGTDVVLGGDVACKKIDIQAQTDNTGIIAVGFTGVDATVATGTGVILNPGDTYSLEVNNLNLIYIDSTVNGEGVRYTYFT